MPDTPKPVWTYTPPEGLRRRLESVMGYRSSGPSEIWAEVRDWLVENGVEMPDHIKPEKLVEEPDRSIR